MWTNGTRGIILITGGTQTMSATDWNALTASTEAIPHNNCMATTLDEIARKLPPLRHPGTDKRGRYWESPKYKFGRK